MPWVYDNRLLSQRTPEGKEFFRSGLCINHWCKNVAHNAYRCSECEEKRIASENEAKLARAKYKQRTADRKAHRVAIGIDGFRKRGAPELRLRRAAHAFTRAAIASGFLVDPTSCACTDCGKQAECYDHRDYSKPMAVDPVCRSCNNIRGCGFMPPLVTATQLRQAA